MLHHSVQEPSDSQDNLNIVQDSEMRDKSARCGNSKQESHKSCVVGTVSKHYYSPEVIGWLYWITLDYI